MLVEGEVDIALLIEPIERPNLSIVPLLKEQICLIGLPDDIRVQKTRIKIRDLAGIPLVMTGLVKSGVRLKLEAAAAHAKVILNNVAEVETAEVARRLVLDGVGLTAHFAAAVKEDIEAGRLRAVPIEGLFLHRVLARAADRPASRATIEVLGILRMVIERHVRDGKWPNAQLT
jgi:LysR family nitrogen assimilation transcriptional regulator